MDIPDFAQRHGEDFGCPETPRPRYNVLPARVSRDSCLMWTTYLTRLHRNEAVPHIEYRRVQ